MVFIISFSLKVMMYVILPAWPFLFSPIFLSYFILFWLPIVVAFTRLWYITHSILTQTSDWSASERSCSLRLLMAYPNRGQFTLVLILRLPGINPANNQFCPSTAFDGDCSHYVNTFIHLIHVVHNCRRDVKKEKKIGSSLNLSLRKNLLHTLSWQRLFSTHLYKSPDQVSVLW
jgi:hypothetical protein